MNYRTIADMSATIRENLHRIPRIPVVGIPRSGMIAASIIATSLHQPLSSIFEQLPYGDFLLVDDSVSGGETLAHVLKSLNTRPTTFAVYVKPRSPKPDIWCEVLPGPRVFEWNWNKHAYSRQAVWDIDGVICDETERIKNWDDLDRIRAVRETARPKFLPKRKVLAIATGRREVEREFTEAWLAKHGVQYEHIFFSTKERGAKRTKLHALQQTKAKWMIESDEQQAMWLRLMTGLPVLCTDLNTVL